MSELRIIFFFQTARRTKYKRNGHTASFERNILIENN